MTCAELMPPGFAIAERGQMTDIVDIHWIPTIPNTPSNTGSGAGCAMLGRSLGTAFTDLPTYFQTDCRVPIDKGWQLNV
jgi:hypothetical protein